MKTLALCTIAALLAAPQARSDEAADILRATGIKGGLVVQIGCGDGKLTAALHANDSYVVQGLDADVTAARRHIRSLGLYGPVTAEPWTGSRLPYIDNLVNLVIADHPGDVPMDEIMRVLAPDGVAFIGGKKTVKPWPDNIDEWTHYLHDPGNNAVAHDTVIGPPRHMQWQANPAWTRNHDKVCSISSVVTARGRLFCIVDEATSANLDVPGKWFIVARDGFSGIQLWERPMDSWIEAKLPFRSGPPQVTRLLVASGEHVYAPLGLNAPVSELDAATGETLRTFDATDGAEELILTGKTLLVVKGAPVAEQAAGHPAFKSLFKSPNQKTIVAIDTASGKTQWTWSDHEKALRPETLAADERRAFVQLDESVTCLELATGKPAWTFNESAGTAPNTKPTNKRRNSLIAFGKYTLVVADGVVLCNLKGQLTALSADDGKKLWACKAGAGFHSPLDVFVIDGLVWQGSHPSDSVAPPPMQDFCEARDLHTGEVKKQNHILVDLQTAGHHHRCYREKATDRFILTGKRGIELMGVAGNSHSRNNWVRGTCQYGIMPANGLLYAPSHDCACYMASLLKGFWALATEQPRVAEAAAKTTDADRLTKGPAYDTPEGTPAEDAEAWPQYRHDALRSGTATTIVPSELNPLWETKIGGRLTAPVVAGGRVLLAAPDENTVYALDAATGRKAWQYVCGGPVDSPPTVHAGLALFGSADGCVYAVRLSDGALAWRFLAAPAELRTVAYDRVEAVWPVHGSVLELNGLVYCAAGRSSWIDGGMYLFGLEPTTGKIRCRGHFASEHPVYQHGKDQAKPEHVTRVAQNTTDYKTFLESDHSDSFSMGGTLSDVLTSDGTHVFLHQIRFDAKLRPQEEMTRHLFATASLLDDAENHRSYWMMGSGDFSRVPVAFSWIAANPGHWKPSLAVPYGLMLTFDDHGLWGVRRGGNAKGNYMLFMQPNRPFADNEPALPDFRPASKEQLRQEWNVKLPIRPRAMLKAGTHLYIGAAAADTPTEDPGAAYEDRCTGLIQVTSTTDGTTLAECHLPAPVAWDGLAAAHHRLYATLANGTVTCLTGKGRDR